VGGGLSRVAVHIDQATVVEHGHDRGQFAGVSPRLTSAEAFVIITPEYNHSFPASLKNLIDWHYTQWQAKPIGFVSYGGLGGGLRAVEQLRQVFAELHAMTERGDFTAPGALLPTVAGLLLSVGFVARGLTARHPLLHLRLFRDRTFAAGPATTTLFPAGYFGSMLLTPMYYQTTRGLTATESGLLGVPLAVAVGTSMQVATRRIDKVSPRMVIVSGIVTAALGLALFAVLLGPDTPYWQLCAAMPVMGIGVGMVMMPAATTATRALAPDDVPSGSTTLNIVSQIGTSNGTALMSVVLAANVAGAAGARQSAAAYQHAYRWAVTLLILASVPALLLPTRRGSGGASTSAPATPVSARTR
jgi:hypothetical protein